jgi:pimeloyl-ACP methyl ester carboxylesterase
MSDEAAVQDAAGLLDLLSRPRRRAVPRACSLLSRGEAFTVEGDFGAVAAWRLGEGPASLLVHGWEDDHSLWTPLVSALRDWGVATVAFDLPGHGFSDGEACDVDGAAAAVRAVARACGPVATAIGHSFGGVAIARALGLGLTLEAVALVAPPVVQRDQFARAAARHGVPDPLARAALALGDARGRWLDLCDLAPAMTTPALFIHSLDDPQCPADEARRACAAWPGARFMALDGLGHRLVAQDQEAVAALVAWARG